MQRQPDHFLPVTLEKSYRLFNHAPTVLISATHGGESNVMAAAWACVLDYGSSPKVTVVLDKATRTRELLKASGEFALQLPTTVMAKLTVGVGTDSARDVPDKLVKHGVELFTSPGSEVPLGKRMRRLADLQAAVRAPQRTALRFVYWRNCGCLGGCGRDLCMKKPQPKRLDFRYGQIWQLRYL